MSSSIQKERHQEEEEEMQPSSLQQTEEEAKEEKEEETEKRGGEQSLRRLPPLEEHGVTEPSPPSQPPPTREEMFKVTAEEKSNNDNDAEKSKDDSFAAEVHSVIQLSPPPQPTQKDILKVDKDLKKQRAVILDGKPEFQPTTEPRPLPLTSSSAQQQQQKVKNDSSTLELQPDSEPDLSQQQTDTHNFNNLGKQTVLYLEEQPVTRYLLSQQDQNDRDKANKNNNQQPHNVNAITRNDVEQDLVANLNDNNQPQDEDEQHRQSQGSQDLLPVIDNAFPVPTPIRPEPSNYPLIEGQVVTPRPPSLTPSQQEAKKIRRNIIVLFIVSAIILAAVLVPILLSVKNNNDDSVGVNSSLFTSNPSASLVPSFNPSTSTIPSSFPSTSSPTSTTFNDVLALIGLDDDDTSLDPNNYVFRSIQWMAEQDQVTRAVLLRQQTTKTEQQDMGTLLIQRFAMVCLYFATEGDLWFDRLGFMNPLTHECQWRVYGREQFLSGLATINCIDNVIRGIALNDNNLSGMLPSEIGLLTRLIALELRNNMIGGTLPSSLFQLSQLVGLVLERNKLSGSIPTGLTTLNNLGILWLRLNDLTGSIPESIGDLTNLSSFHLWGNMLTGSIPSSIQSMTELQLLALSFNMLTSTLPAEINNLQQLEEYGVQANMLTGTLPFKAGANPLLHSFGCDINDLTGDISRLTHLSSLERLRFSKNKFTSTIPPEICNLPLESIDGDHNMLTGSLPYCLGDLKLLTDLFFNRNSLVGSIPTLPTSLKELVLYENHLTGKIPTGPFPSMTALNLHTNNFIVGTIPTELITFTNLQILALGDCQLVGTIHTEIGLLTQLTALALGGNGLFGSIPTEVGLLQKLERLHLSVNRLRGTIPSEIGRMTSLRILALNGNFLTGSLPPTFVNIPVQTLGILSLFANMLMGDVDFFCQNRTFGIFFADCRKLTNCSCCTSCCDNPSALVDDQCVDFFNNL